MLDSWLSLHAAYLCVTETSSPLGGFNMNIEPLLLILPALILFAVVIVLIHNREAPKPGEIAIIAVIVILCGAFLIPALQNLDTEVSGIPDDIQYDDYFKTNAKSASGAIELVDIDGITYAHAIDVGEATLSFSTYDTKVTVNKAVLDVFLLDGQSNMAYNTSFANLTICPSPAPLGKGYYFGSETVPYNPSLSASNCDIYSVTNLDGSAHLGGFEYSFCATWVKLTGHKILTVNCAVGNKSIADFQEGEYMYTHTQEGWDKAISLLSTDLYDYSIKGMVWCQGENDAYNGVSWYESEFEAMLSKFQSDAFTLPIEKCYIELIPPKWVESREALLNLAASNPDVMIATALASTFTVSNGLLQSDETHYTQAGQNLLGAAVAKYVNNHD